MEIINARSLYFNKEIPKACAAEVLFFIASIALPLGLFIRFCVITIRINKTAIRI